MPTVRIRADFGPIERLLSLLQKFMRNPRPALLAIDSAFERTARESFEREASPEGVPWAPLKPSTIEAKIRAKRGSQGILRFSGALLRTTIGGVTPDNRVVFVGSTLPYAGVHQEGFSGRVQVGQYQRRPSVKQRRQRLKRGGPGISGAFFVRAHSREMDIPARPFLPEGPTAEGIAVQTLEDQLQDVINQGGR